MLWLLYLLSTYAVFSIIYWIYRMAVHKSVKNHYILVNIEDDSSNTEGIIRTLMRENPSSEIVLVNNSDEEEVSLIIEKLCKDYTRLHTTKECDIFK